MEDLDVFTALQLKKLKEYNVHKYSKNINKVSKYIEDTVQESFLEGYKVGKSDERFNIKGNIIANLIKNTCMSHEEIFNNVALGEEKWREHIKYLREQYENGKKRGNELINKQHLKVKEK